MGLSNFLSKLEITLKIWAKHTILVGNGYFRGSSSHHLTCMHLIVPAVVHLIVPAVVHLIVPAIQRRKILFWSNLVDQLTMNYESTHAEV